MSDTYTYSEERPQLLATFNAYDTTTLLRLAHVDDAFAALNEFGTYLRNLHKHDGGSNYDTPGCAIDAIYEEFWRICSELKLDPLVD